MTRRDAGRYLLDELRENRLEVVKAGYLRVVNSVNAEWYRRFCGQHLRPRRRYPRLRTIIQRCTTIAALERIASGRERGTVYEERLAAFIDEALHELERYYGRAG